MTVAVPTGAAVTLSVARKNNPRKSRGNLDVLTLSVWDAARVIGVGRDQAYKLIREGRLKALMFGNRWRVPCTEPLEFLSREAK